MKRIMNFFKLSVLQLPVSLRHPNMIGITKALVTPLYTVQRLFSLYREDVLYKINHNGQVCYLRGMLNDTFDSTYRRIKIVEPVRNEFVMIFRRNEMKEVDLGRAIVSRRDSVQADQIDFIVKVPWELYGVDNEARMKAVLNFYKLAGKQYKVDYE